MSRQTVFDQDYVEEQIRWYGGPQTYEDGAVKLVRKKLNGRCDHYLHKAYEVGDLEVPILLIEGKVWMSLTPMEIQSAHVALSMCSGNVGTSGLGMGYFALQAAEGEDVESVTVFEINEKVIDYFNASFKDREGFEKITIVKGDVRETMKRYEFEVFFADHYQHLLDEEIPDDIRLLSKNNKICHYRFWGQELAYFAANNARRFKNRASIPGFTHRDGYFFTDFFSSNERACMYRTDVEDDAYFDKVFPALKLAEQRGKKWSQG